MEKKVKRDLSLMSIETIQKDPNKFYDLIVPMIQREDNPIIYSNLISKLVINNREIPFNLFSGLIEFPKDNLAVLVANLGKSTLGYQKRRFDCESSIEEVMSYFSEEECDIVEFLKPTYGSHGVSEIPDYTFANSLNQVKENFLAYKHRSINKGKKSIIYSNFVGQFDLNYIGTRHGFYTLDTIHIDGMILLPDEAMLIVSPEKDYSKPKNQWERTNFSKIMNCMREYQIPYERTTQAVPEKWEPYFNRVKVPAFYKSGDKSGSSMKHEKIKTK